MEDRRRKRGKGEKRKTKRRGSEKRTIAKSIPIKEQKGQRRIKE